MSGIPTEAVGHVVELVKRHEFDKLSFYQPFPYQERVHAARDKQGNLASEVAFMAGNRSGKTYAAKMDGAIHLTGRYPDWWKGVRYNRPVMMWVGGVTNLTTRDIFQREMFGEPGEAALQGTGSIPKDAILQTTPRRGVPDAIDTALIRHESGRPSRVQFLSYEMGKNAWMGQGQDIVLLDEEPPADIFSQARRAVSLSPQPRILLSFTPEHGMTAVAKEFWVGPLKTGQALVVASLNDRPDLTAERVEEIISRYPEHEREMRRSGQPIFGAAQVLGAPEDLVRCKPFPIPDYWRRVAAIDFGYYHPAAGAWMAVDAETDTFYIYHGFRASRASPPEIVSMMNSLGKDIPWIWPADGLQDRGLGPLAEKYRELGANMMDTHFQNPPVPDGNGGYKPGGISKAPGIEEMRDRENTGRLKVFDTIPFYFEERRVWYYDEKGKVSDVNEDFLSAVRYCVQSARFAVMPASWRRRDRQMIAEGVGPGYDPGHDYNADLPMTGPIGPHTFG